MTDKIIPRPIAELTNQMGMVLLIGASGYTTTPTRAEVGYRDANGRLRTYDGETFTSGGEDATSFIAIPYDQEAAVQMAKGVVQFPHQELIELLTTLRGLAFELADAIGPQRALNQLRLTLSAFGEVDGRAGPGERLISSLRNILDHADESDEAAEYDINKVRTVIDQSDAAKVVRPAA